MMTQHPVEIHTVVRNSMALTVLDYLYKHNNAKIINMPKKLQIYIYRTKKLLGRYGLVDVYLDNDNKYNVKITENGILFYEAVLEIDKFLQNIKKQTEIVSETK